MFRKMMIPLLITLSAAVASAAEPSAMVVKLSDGRYMAIVTLPSGEMLMVGKVVMVEMPVPHPSPTTKVSSAIIVYESGDQTQEQNQVQIQIRLDPKLSKKLPLILDKDTTLSDGNPIPKLQSALNLIGSQPLPQLVGFDGSGEAVVREAVPATAREVGEILGRWGL